jgi:hypothetical protein
MSAKDGGSAFPNQVMADMQRHGGPIAYIWTGGMSLRDYFAAKAMSGAINAYMHSVVDDFGYREIAMQSYKIADAMLKERES